jgi:hypothetical protein
MILSDYDLRQIDENYLHTLLREELLGVSMRLLKDLKEARERINQNPNNSSRPPSSREPWEISRIEKDDDELNEKNIIEGVDSSDEDLVDDNHIDENSNEDLVDDNNIDEKKEVEKSSSKSTQSRKAGKQQGAIGYGRTQKLSITDEIIHRATECAACGKELGEEAKFIARTGHYIIDIELGTPLEPGIHVTNNKHLYGETICLCGHVTWTSPHRCENELGWDVELTEWHLVGPQLVSLICCLNLRMKLSRARIQELLREWLHLHLSIGTINQCIHEAGRAVAPLEKQLIDEIVNSELLHADETSWQEKDKSLWLWVFLTTKTVLYIIGRRMREVVESILGKVFKGWLMSDGYIAYRWYKDRLRCWSHLIRKARGLEESLNKSVQIFGKKVLDVLNTLMEAVYRVREGPKEDLVEKYHKIIEELRCLCEDNRNNNHKKTSDLAKEFLNDWDAIFLVLSHPELPLTNNEAERVLRHWVIIRKLSYGTRTKQGSHVFTLLASVIDTCRRRNISPWEYLTKVITYRRQGKEVPPIPATT